MSRRIISTFEEYMSEQERLGNVTETTHEEAQNIDLAIAKVFIEAKKLADIKQMNSMIFSVFRNLGINF